MPKKIARDVVRQLAQLAGETAGEIKKQPGEMAETTLEQLGVKPPEPSLEKPKDVKLEQLKQQKTIQTQRQITQVEQELHQLVAERQRQKEKWQQAQEGKMTKGKKEETKEPTPVVPSKPKRRLFGFWSRRVKTAQEQAKPEMVGKRVGG